MLVSTSQGEQEERQRISVDKCLLFSKFFLNTFPNGTVLKVSKEDIVHAREEKDMLVTG
jgi:hypothetical protein